LASLLGHDYGHGHPIEETHRIGLNQSESRAVLIATERYAKGEITRDEYLKMLDDLRHQAT
jgi:uncharacterized membrane protein